MSAFRCLCNYASGLASSASPAGASGEGWAFTSSAGAGYSAGLTDSAAGFSGSMAGFGVISIAGETASSFGSSIYFDLLKNKEF